MDWSLDVLGDVPLSLDDFTLSAVEAGSVGLKSPTFCLASFDPRNELKLLAKFAARPPTSAAPAST